MVTLPAKPASHARPINLDGTEVTMTMTAARVDDVTFAVGVVELPDASQTSQALQAMKTALVRNIDGTILQERVSDAGTVPPFIEIEARGSPGARAPTLLLLARFVAKEQRVYQIIVLGDETQVSREAANTFFSSFHAY